MKGKKKGLRRERENSLFVCGKTMYRMREKKNNKIIVIG